MLRNFSIYFRVCALAFVAALFMAGMLVGFHYATAKINAEGTAIGKTQIYEAQRERIKDIVGAAAQGLGELVAGKSEAEQLSIIEQFTDKSRFDRDGSGYFFVHKGTVCVALPVQKETVGKDRSDETDKNGVYFVRDLERAANAGGGFVDFVFAKPGAGDVPKVGYAMLIPNTPFWMGTGVYLDNVQALGERLQSAMKAQEREAITRMIVFVVAVLLIVGCPLAVWVISSIVKPLHNVTNLAQRIAQGDLSVRILPHGKDEVAQLEEALRSMVQSLTKNLNEARDESQRAAEQTEKAKQAMEEARRAQTAAESAKREGMLAAARQLEGIVAVVSSASTQLSAQVERSKRGAAVTSERVGETATAMEEMNATVLEVARNAGDAAGAATAMRDNARDGAEIVNDVVRGMSVLHASASSLKGDMDGLNAQAEGIGVVMAVISDIADQTNLLALNAAIEAARAGEAGRGFAVVADEVRKLAEKTMQATQEVGKAVQEIQLATRKSLANVEGAVQAINRNNELATRSGQALGQILHRAEDAADRVRAIATAAEEQSATSEEINRALETVNSNSTETAGVMAEAARAVSSLAAQAHRLTEIIGDMKRA